METITRSSANWSAHRYRRMVFSALTFSALLAPLMAAAQVTDICSVLNILNRIAQLFAYVIGIIAVIMLLYSAFLFITGGGNEETIKKARQFLIYGLIGIAVALLAFNVVAIVKTVVPGTALPTSCPG